MVNIEEIRNFYLTLPYVFEGFPFGEDILVLKVGSKVFALLVLESDEPFIQLKCDPDKAEELRARYSAVLPAWHMNKRHWNKVLLRGDISTEDVIEQIQDSYRLVWQKISKKEQTILQANR